MRIKVFEDISPVNGAFDAPGENGLPGFRAIINDTLGQISQDVFGNALCTEYVRDAGGQLILDPDGNPIPDPSVRPTDACLYSDANGDIVIPNLGPLRFDIIVVPPNGTNWTETTTLEGGWGWDTWAAEGYSGFDNEFVVAGEPFPWTWFGFVQPTDAFTSTTPTGGVSGTIMQAYSIRADVRRTALSWAGCGAA